MKHLEDLILPSTRRTVLPESKLACAIIEQALRDVWALQADRATTIRTRADARAFLLTRTDRLVRFWFAAAGVNLDACRAHWRVHGFPRLHKLTGRPRAGA